MERKSIGSFIAAMRKANGLTQKQLAEKLNVSDKAVSRWERDECAPDLSLIPVIAEIFDVTADELLCGERRATSDENFRPKRTEKQKKRILNQTLSKFRTQSLISLGITVIALFSELLLEFVLENHYICLLVTLVLTASSCVCETIFLGNAIRSAGDEEFDDINTNFYKIKAVNFAKIIYAINFSLVFTCISLIYFLPFCSGITSNSFYEMFSAISPSRPHNIFSADIMLIALLYIGGGALLFRTIWLFVLKALEKRGFYPIDEKTSALNKFKKRFLMVSTIVVGISVLLCPTISNMQNIYGIFMSSGIVFENTDEFISYMEKDVQRGDYNLSGLTMDFVSSDFNSDYSLSENDKYVNATADEAVSFYDYGNGEAEITTSAYSENLYEIFDENNNVTTEFYWNNNEVYSYSDAFENGVHKFYVESNFDYVSALMTVRTILTMIILAELLIVYATYPILMNRKKKKL